MKSILKFLKRSRSALLVLVLPLLVVLIYNLGMARDRFTSESVVTIKQAAHFGGERSGMAAMLMPGVSPLLREDVLYLRTFIHSQGLLGTLDRELKLREHFSSSMRDPLHYLPTSASREDFLEFYRKRVEIVLDDISGLLTLRTQGFEPEYARRLNATILRECEAFVNRMSQNLAAEQLRFTDAEVGKTTARLEDAQARLVQFQAQHRVLDAAAQASAAGAITNELQAQLSKLEAEHKTLLGYLHPSAHQVQALQNQIAAIKSQLQSEQNRGTQAADASKKLGAIALQFEQLKQQVGLAQESHKAALAAAEAMRLEATRKLKSLVVVEAPTLAETAEYPRRLYNLFAALVVLLLLYAVAQLTLATIAEHRD
ncbi:capsular biosynthesis protein [Roseateles sp. BYS180W]|uniref:Capsular biosynthesis protein n=1 Tax=Roseateles rivi TaxID=3299028 RepID=A0ABW7FZQ4_9BURK